MSRYKTVDELKQLDLYEKTNFIDVETNLEKLQVKSKEYLKSVVEEI